MTLRPEVEKAATVGTPDTTLKGPFSALSLLLGFLALWGAFYLLNRAAPYVANGSDVIKAKKKEYEAAGKTFQNSRPGLKVAIFGDSKVLSGFIPDLFDSLPGKDHTSVNSFNSGFPAQSEFLDELVTMLDQHPAPDVVLITIPWQHRSRHFSIFSLSTDDNQLASDIFPFRFLFRNVSRFLSESRQYGGIRNFYQYTKQICDSVLAARGYYYIKELKVYPDGKLPPDWTLPSDHPNKVDTRQADFESAELDRLNQALQRHHVRCFFVPEHFRSTAAAPAPPINTDFATKLAEHSSCRVLGPDYFSYSPTLYSDDLHLNPEGAQAYTQDIYKLVAPQIEGGH